MDQPDLLAFMQHIEESYVPSGYEVWRNGVFKREMEAVPTPMRAHPNLPLPPECRSGRKLVTLKPIWISAAGYTIDTHEPLIKLSYYTPGDVRMDTWVSRTEITDHAALTKLASRSLPVTSNNARALINYLTSYEAFNGPLLPPVLVGHRSGSYRIGATKQVGFLIGKQWIGPGHLDADPRNDRINTNGYVAHGSYDVWLAEWRKLYALNWMTRWSVAATFAAPLLQFCKVRTFIIHHWGSSSKGKTAVKNFALSAWGDPAVISNTLNDTKNSLIEQFKYVTDLPMLYDESQLTDTKPQDIIFSICNSTSKGRAEKTGGVQQNKYTWLSVAWTTGEKPLVPDNDPGGQLNRVLQVRAQAYDDQVEAAKLYPFAAEHHGHAGPAFLRQLVALINRDDGRERITASYQQLRDLIATRIGNTQLNHVNYVAVIALAQVLSAKWLLGMDIEEAKAIAVDDAERALKETAPLLVGTYAERALSALRDHWVTNSGCYMNDMPAINDTGGTDQEKAALKQLHNKGIKHLVGIEQTDGIAYIPTEVNEILHRHGLSHGRVWSDFASLGWLIVARDLPYQCTVSLKGGDHNVYYIKREIWNAAIRPQKTGMVRNMADGGLVNGAAAPQVAEAAAVNELDSGLRNTHLSGYAEPEPAAPPKLSLVLEIDDGGES